MLKLQHQHQSYETSIVRVRVKRSLGWRFGCGVSYEKKSKRLLMENRFGFDWLTIGFFKLVDSRKKPKQSRQCIKKWVLPLPTYLPGQGG
jgi:hypothetical protein